MIGQVAAGHARAAAAAPAEAGGALSRQAPSPQPSREPPGQQYTHVYPSGDTYEIKINFAQRAFGVRKFFSLSGFDSKKEAAYVHDKLLLEVGVDYMTLNFPREHTMQLSTNAQNRLVDGKRRLQRAIAEKGCATQPSARDKAAEAAAAAPMHKRTRYEAAASSSKRQKTSGDTGLPLKPAFLGLRVRKYFAGKPYEGTAALYNAKTAFYKVNYDDGDREDNDAHDMLAILKPHYFISKVRPRLAEWFLPGGGRPASSSSADCLFGCTFSRDVRARLTSHFARADIREEFPSVSVTSQDPMLSKEVYHHAICEYLAKIGFDPGSVSPHVPVKLPAEAPHDPRFEEFRIGSADPRVGLRGGMGCRAVADVPSGTVVGVYTGHVFTHAEKFNTPAILKAKASDGPSRAEWLAESFTAEFTSFNASRGLERHDILAVCALDFPGVCHRANEGLIDPFGRAATESVAKPNAEYVEAEVHGWPLVFVVTIAALRCGEEVVVSYGDAYWELMTDFRERVAFQERPL